MLYDTTPTPAVDWVAIALAKLDLELVAAIPFPDVVDDVEARVLIPVELTDDPVAEVGLLLSELKVAVGSEDIDVGMRIDTAVELFTAVRNEVGMLASGDAVRGSLKMLQISAMASKVCSITGYADRLSQHDQPIRTFPVLPNQGSQRFSLADNGMKLLDSDIHFVHCELQLAI